MLSELDLLQEKAESRDHKAKSHQSQTGTDPARKVRSAARESLKFGLGVISPCAFILPSLHRVFPFMFGELAIMLWLIIMGAKERQPVATAA